MAQVAEFNGSIITVPALWFWTFWSLILFIFISKRTDIRYIKKHKHNPRSVLEGDQVGDQPMYIMV